MFPDIPSPHPNCYITAGSINFIAFICPFIHSSNFQKKVPSKQENQSISIAVWQSYSNDYTLHFSHVKAISVNSLSMVLSIANEQRVEIRQQS